MMPRSPWSNLTGYADPEMQDEYGALTGQGGMPLDAESSGAAGSGGGLAGYAGLASLAASKGDQDTSGTSFHEAPSQLSAGGKGAMSGASLGPWGMLAGAALGIGKNAGDRETAKQNNLNLANHERTAWATHLDPNATPALHTSNPIGDLAAGAYSGLRQQADMKKAAQGNEVGDAQAAYYRAMADRLNNTATAPISAGTAPAGGDYPVSGPGTLPPGYDYAGPRQPAFPPISPWGFQRGNLPPGYGG